MKTWLNILLSFSLLALSGCGDLGEKKKVAKSLQSNQFELGCKINVDAFSRILHDSISSEIMCLQKSLHLYLKVVESDRPNHLGRVAFESFIRNYMPEVDHDTVNAIKVVFDLNHLITGEDPDYISAQNVDRLIDFALTFNREAAKNYAPIFEDEELVTFAVHELQQERVKRATQAMLANIHGLYVRDRKQVHKINLIDLLDKITTSDNREDIEKFKKVLFAKKAVLGGEESILTHVELGQIIDSFQKLSGILLDLYRYKYVTIEQRSLLKRLHQDIVDLKEIMFPIGKPRSGETLFTLNQAVDAIKVFVPKEDLDIDKLRRPLEDGKRMIMGGDPAFITSEDIKKLFEHASVVLNRGEIFHRIYATFKAQLDREGPVDINFSHYRQNYPPEDQKELNQFERIVKKYRFFKGEFISPYFTREHKRNADALFEMALWEYGMQILFQHYGTKSNALGGYSMDQKAVQNLIAKYDQELIDLDLFLPGMGRINADNIALLGTLFQYQSDNNKVLDINEASEFAVSLITSLKTSKDLFKHLVDNHQCKTDNYDRIESNCFRSNFMKSVCELYRPYFPRLFEAYNTPGSCADLVSSGAIAEYLDVSIKAARTCNYYPDGNKEEIYYSEGDIVTIMVVFMHIETTIIRWDKNSNNFMDVEEVEAAYSIYSGALDGFLEGKGIIQKFKKQIYQYMIKFETVPDEKKFGSVMKFIGFLLTVNKKSSANRKTIANILYQIGEQNKKLPGYQAFDCKALRNPTNIDPNNTYLPVTQPDKGPDFSHLLEGLEHLAEPIK